MSNYRVPDFWVGQDEPLGDELAEILWRKGPVLRRFQQPLRAEQPPAYLPAEGMVNEEQPCELFLEEDELASWLHHNVEDELASGLDHFPSAIPPPPSRDSTVVGSSWTPAQRRAAQPITADEPRAGGVPASSSGGSGEDRKRKSRDSERFDDEAAEEDLFQKRKDGRTTGRRTRAAEVHNLSERRRRDRINEKMKALQQLIPRCNKTDKASMLDDAVEYLKSLQLQIQMMSMGCTMPTMMYPGIAPHPQMFMGMGGDPNAARMACPMLPFPPVMQGLHPTGSTSHLGAGMPMQAFHPAHLFLNGRLTSSQAGQSSDLPSSAFPIQGQNPPQVMNMPVPNLQYFSPQKMPQPLENQALIGEQGSFKSALTSEKQEAT